MAFRRQVNPEVQKIYEKYLDNSSNVRRLPRPAALQMMETEFGIPADKTTAFFEHFVLEKNDYISLWEFQHFYNIAGKRSLDIVRKFERLDKGNKGYLSVEEAREALGNQQTAGGEPLDDKEVDFFLKTAFPNDATSLSLGDFVDLLARLRMYHRPKK